MRLAIAAYPHDDTSGVDLERRDPDSDASSALSLFISIVFLAQKAIKILLGLHGQDQAGEVDADRPIDNFIRFDHCQASSGSSLPLARGRGPGEVRENCQIWIARIAAPKAARWILKIAL